MTSPPAVLEELDLLTAIHPAGETFTICAYGAKGAKNHQFFTHPQAALDYAQKLDTDSRYQGVFWGMADIKEPETGRGTEADVIAVRVAWADIDAKGADGNRDKDLAHQYLAEAMEKGRVLPPSAVVDSGGGLQCYWFLGTPATGEDLLRLKALNRRIGFHVHGDATHDLARVLRVPGTHNKKMEYGTPRLCRLLSFDPTCRYDLHELAQAANCDFNYLEPLAGEVEKGFAIDFNAEVPEAWVKHVQDKRRTTIHRLLKGLTRPGNDNTQSGIAFAIITYAINKGFTKPEDLAAIVVNVPSCKEYAQKKKQSLIYSIRKGLREKSTLNTPAAGGGPKKKIGDVICPDDMPKHIKLFEMVNRRWDVKTVAETQRTYYYENGRYVKDSDCNMIAAFIAENLQEDYSLIAESTALKYIIRRTRTPYKEFQQQANFLNFNNGILDMDTMKLMPHSPDFLSFEQIPIDYDPDAKCPEFIKFLEDVLGSKKDCSLLIQFIGYMFWKDGNPYQKAMMLTGTGANGKSTLLNAVHALFGENNAVSLTPQQLETEPQAAGMLVDKLANIVHDVNPEPLRKTDIFKKTTAGEPMMLRPLYAKDYIAIKPYAKHIFACNSAPRPRYDDSDAFYRRWAIINFPHNFDGQQCRVCGKVHAVNAALHKLLKTELPGIINMALAALKAVLDNNGFIDPPSLDETRLAYEISMDSVTAFAKKKLDWDGTDREKRTAKSVVFDAFIKWATKEAGVPTVSEIGFGRKLKTIFPGLDGTGRVKGGNREHAWYGLSLRDEDVADGEKGSSKLDGKLDVGVPEKSVPDSNSTRDAIPDKSGGRSDAPTGVPDVSDEQMTCSAAEALWNSLVNTYSSKVVPDVLDMSQIKKPSGTMKHRRQDSSIPPVVPDTSSTRTHEE